MASSMGSPVSAFMPDGTSTDRIGNSERLSSRISSIHGAASDRLPRQPHHGFFGLAGSPGGLLPLAHLSNADDRRGHLLVTPNRVLPHTLHIHCRAASSPDRPCRSSVRLLGTSGDGGSSD